jgi:hypothetical protein
MSRIEAAATDEITGAAAREIEQCVDSAPEPAGPRAPRLVGMVGKARSGKDTFARVLTEVGEYERVALADELKRDVASFLGVSVEELETRKADFRAALQEYGSRMRREREDWWIAMLTPKVRELLAIGHDVVVTDVRYQNEAEWVRSLGGVIVKRVRAGHEGAGGALATHSSETELDSIRPDFVCNCATVPEIQAHAREFLVRPVGDM